MIGRRNSPANRYLIAILVLCLFASAISASAQNATRPPLTNDDVIQMVKANLSESLILVQIRNSPTTFNLTVSEVIRLSTAGVTDTLIAAMRVPGAPTVTRLAQPGATRIAAGQTPGERVYAVAAESTFFLSISDSSGTDIGQATGFLVSANQILTNAHVAQAGAISVRLGSLQVACDVKRSDSFNDLAICEMAARITANPLKLADSEPNPGATVFAFGNPRGFEKTISQGLFTGFRDLDGRRVAQISAALSPGSSGGPILSTEGEVVGVAVSSMTNGQALNFAVPIGIVRDFLSGRGTAADAKSLVIAAKALTSERDALPFGDPKWKALDGQIASTLTQAVVTANSAEILNDAIDAAGFLHYDIKAAAARKVIQLTTLPTREMFHALAAALYYSTDEPGPSATLKEAESAADRAVFLGRGLVAEDLSLLAGIQSQSGNRQLALATYLRASTVAKPRSEELAKIYMNLFRVSDALGKSVDAESWFKKAAATIDQPGYNLKEYATFLEQQSRQGDAGAILLEAFRREPAAYAYVCQAGADYYLATKYDEALLAARRCLELASQKDASSELARSHKIMSAMLAERGVYDESANHAREAITLDPEDSQAHYDFARALLGLRRFTEAVSSAKSAIRLSDGKWGYMHFALGNAYFELQQWPEAIQSYEKAAELSPNDEAAAFNLAVSFYNSRYYPDALKWYREALRRNPNGENKVEIIRMINQLSKP